MFFFKRNRSYNMGISAFENFRLGPPESAEPSSSSEREGAQGLLSSPSRLLARAVRAVPSVETVESDMSAGRIDEEPRFMHLGLENTADLLNFRGLFQTWHYVSLLAYVALIFVVPILSKLGSVFYHVYGETNGEAEKPHK